MTHAYGSPKLSLYRSYAKKISEVIWGHMVKYKGQILNNIKWQNKRCQLVGLGQTCKSLHGDAFVRPTVPGSKVKKVKFQTTSNGKINAANMLALVKHAKVSTVTSPSDLQFRGQRSKKVKYQTTSNGKTNGANMLAWSTKVKFQTTSISKSIIANQLALEKHAKVSTVTSSTDKF